MFLKTSNQWGPWIRNTICSDYVAWGSHKHFLCFMLYACNHNCWKPVLKMYFTFNKLLKQLIWKRILLVSSRNFGSTICLLEIAKGYRSKQKTGHKSSTEETNSVYSCSCKFLPTVNVMSPQKQWTG